MNKIDYGKIGSSKNFTSNTLTRYIMIDKSILPEERHNELLDPINEQLDKLIQDVNACSIGRVLPYIKVQRVVEENDKLRIVINNLDNNTMYIDRKDLSLLINFRLPSPQKVITVCDQLIKGDAKMIIDSKNQVAAAVDIFLDIAMFHSYSFLDKMSNQEKQLFNMYKYDHFIDNGYESYYLIDTDNPPKFLSFAFAARSGNRRFNVEQYCSIWERFINENYNGKTHEISAPEEQMKQHMQKDMIDKRYFTSEFWSEFPAGDYLFLRINREPNTNERKDELAKYFNVPKFHIGPTKVVPISEYNRRFLKGMLNEHYVSALKIVVN